MINLLESLFPVLHPIFLNVKRPRKVTTYRALPVSVRACEPNSPMGLALDCGSFVPGSSFTEYHFSLGKANQQTRMTCSASHAST